jgi:DNA polymerase-3 subunit alpha
MHIEDLKGQCEVVVFPKTYAQYKDKLELDSVVLIKGQAQTRNGQTNLLADTIQNYVEQAINTGMEANEYQQQIFDGGPTINGVTISASPQSNGADNGATGATAHNSAVTNQVTENGTSEGTNGMNGIDGNGIDERDALPTGEENPFRGSPPDWAMESLAEAEPVRTAVQEESKTAPAAPDPAGEEFTTKAQGAQREPKVPQPAPDPVPDASETAAEPVMVAEASTEYVVESADESDSSPQNVEEEAVAPPIDPAVTEALRPETLPSPAPKPARRQPQRLTISFLRSGDIDRDIFRLKELYELVRDPRGRDRFRVRLESKGKPVTLDFPNDYCTINERLTGDITRSFRVEISVEEG